MEEADGNRWSRLYCMSLTAGAHQVIARQGNGNTSSIIKDINNRDESLEAFVSKIREDDSLCDLLKQRRTRWLEEEEDFAKFLVREFEHGIARDVENNSTLRAYLSRKLICTPMRVSKKFVGKKVGTIFYKGKVVLPHIAEISAQAHLELEKNCLSALVIAIDRSKGTELKSSAPELKSSTHQAVMPLSSQLNTLQTTANQVPEQHIHQKLECKQDGIPSGRHPYQSINRGNALLINRSQNLLHYHTSRANTTNSVVQTRAPNPNDCTRTGLTAKDAPVNLASYNGRNAILSKAICGVQDPINAQRDGAGIIFQGISTEPVFGTTTGCDSSMLDLVSGFDKHTALLNAKRDITAVLESRPSSTTWPENSHFFEGTIGESPYITSKSFDELHKCLGKDVPHNPSYLDLNETIVQKSDNYPALAVDSPYITSKSFDEMHKCLGIGLSSSMSHIRLSNVGMSSETPGFESSETLVLTGSNLGHIDGSTTQDVPDPRSDRCLSAFSPFDAKRTVQNHERAMSSVDKLIKRETAPYHAHRGFSLLQDCEKSNSSYVHETHPSSNHIVQGFNTSMSYAAPSEYGLALFLQNSKDVSRYPQVVSTSTSEHSSDRGINSSPDCADVQSD